MPPKDGFAVLTAVARLAAEAASLEDLVPRLARIDSVVLYVVRADGEMEVTGHRIADITAGSSDAIDREARSRIICTVSSRSQIHGALWFTSSRPDAFSASHQILMEAVADLLVL